MLSLFLEACRSTLTFSWTLARRSDVNFADIRAFLLLHLKVDFMLLLSQISLSVHHRTASTEAGVGCGASGSDAATAGWQRRYRTSNGTAD